MLDGSTATTEYFLEEGQTLLMTGFNLVNDPSHSAYLFFRSQLDRDAGFTTEAAVLAASPHFDWTRQE